MHRRPGVRCPGSDGLFAALSCDLCLPSWPAPCSGAPRWVRGRGGWGPPPGG